MKSTIALIACGASLLVGALAWAAADNGFHDKPASPRSLPADNLPPFNMLDDKRQLIPMPPLPPGGLHRNAGPESTAPGPNLALATEAATAAVGACAASGFLVGVAVIDSIGEARAMLTADGSDGSHVFVAMRKAITALAYKMPSLKANELVMKDQRQLSRATPAMFIMGGAVPIVVGGQVIGAIGVSGAAGPPPMGHQDELCAQAGLDKIAARLKQ
jgi:uncharacterized protein GlcG (DUF336 family)